jgi:hypothetical protein
LTSNLSPLDKSRLFLTCHESGSPTRKAHQADAMGCQREIVKTIVEKDADYVIAVKQNQPTLYEQVKQLFKQAIEREHPTFYLAIAN